MNYLEYSEVMKAVKLPMQCWNNLTIRFGGTFYAVVEGNIPLEVANIIYEKYPDNPYGIRVNGGCNDLNPNEFYPTYYHIDSKEGLVIFVTEMKDYLARKAGLAETEVQRFDELMASVNSEILKKVNPTISAYEWMQTDERNSEVFSQTVSEGVKTSFGEALREAIDNFDKTVNPFINSDIKLDEIENYLQRVHISAYTYDSEDEERKNCCQMRITDLESGNQVDYYRRPSGFLYQLNYTLGKEQYLTALHYYSDDKNDRGEVVAINYWGANMPQKIDVRYNLTEGVIGTQFGPKIPVTPDQEKFVYDELLKATDIASLVALNNMKKKVVPKQLLPVTDNK